MLWCEHSNVDFLGTDINSFFEVTKLGGFAPGTQRTVLTQNTCYYIDPAGDDTADGLTPGTAWQTLQTTFDKIATFDLNIYDLTIQFANGTYTNTDRIVTKAPVSSGGRVVLQGNTSDNTLVVIQGQQTTTANNVIRFAHGPGVTFAVRYLTFELDADSTSTIISLIEASLVTFFEIRINSTANSTATIFSYLDCRDLSVIKSEGGTNTTVFDSAIAQTTAHLVTAINGGQVIFTSGNTFDVAGNFTITTGTTGTRLLGLLDFIVASWNTSGSLSGTAIFGQSGVTRLPVTGDLTTIPPFDGSNNLFSGAVTI